MSPVLGLPVLPSTGRPAGPATPHSQGQQRRHRPPWWVSDENRHGEMSCLTKHAFVRSFVCISE